MKDRTNSSRFIWSITFVLVLSGALLTTGCKKEEDIISLAEPKTAEATKSAAEVQQTPAAAETKAAEPQTPVIPAVKPAPVKAGNPVVVMKTSKGQIRIELYPDKAPVTVENFLKYVKLSYYNGTIFHRVIPGFMIQGGGMTPAMAQKQTMAPIKNEASNGLKNDRGTIAMARTNAPDSATSQFFINVNNNLPLNYVGPGQEGYAVFGKVIEGMDVADAIVSVPTKRVGPHANVPAEPIVIESVTVAE